MRTTVRLDPALMARAKEEAARKGVTLTALIERGLRLVLARPAQRPVRRRMRIPVSTARGGTHPGVHLDNSAALVDLLEERDSRKTAFYGRIFFGAAAVLFGVIALMWHDPDTWQNLQEIWKLPFGSIIGGCLMVLQIAGGIGMQHRRTAHLASVILAAIYLLFSLACIPDIIAAANIYERYGGSFFQFFSLLCGATALYAATEANAARAAVLGRLARLGLGVCAISFTLGQILLPRETAGLVPKWIPPGQMFWAILTTIAFALAAVAILIHRQARLAARLMTLMLALFGVLVWIPRLIAHPEAHGNWSEFALTLLISGATWMVAELKSL